MVPARKYSVTVGSVSSFDRTHGELEICASNLAPDERKQHWNKSPHTFMPFCVWVKHSNAPGEQAQTQTLFSQSLLLSSTFSSNCSSRDAFVVH